MRFTHRDLGDYRIGRLTSLIDVVFLLLVFFMVTSSFTSPETELASALGSENSSAAPSDFEPQIIWVEADRDGSPLFRLGARTLTDKASLTLILRELPKEGGVFVRPIDSVPWWATADALQACHDAGFSKVTYVPAQ